MTASIVLTLACAVWPSAQPDSAAPVKPAVAAVVKPAAAPAKDEHASEAERIGRLERTIEADQKSLETLQAQLEDPNNTYHKTEKFFREIDEQLREQRKQHKQLTDDGKTQEAAALQPELEMLEKRRQMARDRFDTAIEENKVFREKAAALTEKIRQDKQALDRLTGSVHPKARPEAVVPTAPAPVVATGTTPAPVAPALTPAVAVALQASATPAAPVPVAGVEKPVSRELLKARADAREKEEAAAVAKEAAESLTGRVDALRKNIVLEERLLENSRKKLDQIQQARTLFDGQLQKKVAARAPQAELEELLTKLERIQVRSQEIETESRTSTDRLNELQTELSVLQSEQLAAMQEAERRAKEAKTALDQVAKLQNPFTLHNVGKWLMDHGPKLFFILTGILILRRLVTLSSRRLAAAMACHGVRGSIEERENRAQTLVGVFRNTASLGIGAGGFLMLSDEVGIPVVPLMGGAAVFGLAVAFGAQNLIRDYFSGFMVLMEDQYGIGDVIKIGDTSGTVERISLRVTVLRDLEGVVHFIPHGHITTVSNMTHGWSRALFEVGVAYHEDVDRVMAILLELAHALRHDEVFGREVMEEPEMLGVDSLGESAVVVKFFLKTRPLRQWMVKRELLRRIKRKFDELKIEIPYPHRTIYHRYEDDQGTQMQPNRAA